MGDRGNIYVHEGDEPGVYLYTHWGASRLDERLRTALTRGQTRWDDTPYLTRIIFSEMIRDDVDGLTGYGISTQLTKGRVVIDIDTARQCVNGHVSFVNYIGSE